MVETIEDKRAGSIEDHLAKISYLTGLERETGVDPGPLIVATWQEVLSSLGMPDTTISEIEDELFRAQQLECEGKSVCGLKRNTNEQLQRQIEDKVSEAE
jgi:hypothetical protein